MNVMATTPRPILCCTDFSDGAGAAVEHAIRLGRALRAPVVIAHAMDTGADADAATPPEIAEAERVLRARVGERVEDARTALGSLAAEAGAGVTSTILNGRPADAIVAYAAAIDADWVVVGAHGASSKHAMRDAALGWLLGSTAERVVRNAGRPVIVVPPR